MKRSPFHCLIAVLLACLFLSSGLAGCGTVQPVSSSASVVSSSVPVADPGSSEGVASASASGAFVSVAQAVPSASVAEALPLPTEPFYYSYVRTHTRVGMQPFFFYSLDRNALAPLTYQDLHTISSDGIVTVPAAAMYDVTFAGHGLLVGTENERVDISRDGGATWESTVLPLAALSWTFSGVLNVGFSSPTDGWVAVFGHYKTGEDERMICGFTTRDGGKTWQSGVEQAVGESYNTTVQFINAEHGFLATRAEPNRDGVFVSTFLETRDGGTTWEPCQILLPPGFANPVQEGWVEELYCDGQGVKCVYRAVAYNENEPDNPYNWMYVSMLLTPVEEDGTTTWRLADAWELPAGIKPYAFFSFVGGNMYDPGYYGIDGIDSLDEQGGEVSHFLMDRLWRYTYENEPDGDTRQWPIRYHFSAEQIADMLAAVYNLKDFDVTTLSPYNEEEQAFVWSCAGEHGMRYQASAYLSVRVTQEGNIELIRDVSAHTSEAYVIQRSGIEGATQLQRCVFKPATCANGEAVFTILECENLDAYPEE